MSSTLKDPALLADVSWFLYEEARLLDARRFEEWSALFCEDALYWAPLEPGQVDHINTMSIFKDDRDLLRARVARLRHPDAHADTPPPRTVHLVTNIQLGACSDAAVDVCAALMMVEWRDARQTVYAARVDWILDRRQGSGFKIQSKRVELVNCDGFHSRMTVPF